MKTILNSGVSFFYPKSLYRFDGKNGPVTTVKPANKKEQEDVSKHNQRAKRKEQ